MVPHSTAGLQPRKRRNTALRPKPPKDFPVTPHIAGFWVKKINKRLHDFERWGRRVRGKMVRIERDGCENAKRHYDTQIDDLIAGRPPRVTSLDQLDGPGACHGTTDGLIRLKDICNDFLTTQQRKLDAV